MRRICQNCKYQTGCKYYADCFYGANRPNFKPSDTAILLDVFKKNQDIIVAETEEEKRVLEDFKKTEK